MSERTIESQFYIGGVVLVSLVGLFWMLLRHSPEIETYQSLILTASFLAIVLEVSGSALPYAGGVSAAAAFYIFILLAGNPPLAAIVAFMGAALRAMIRERAPLLLRICFPFQRLLAVEVAGLPVLLNFGSQPASVHQVILCAAAPLYFVIDAVTEGTAVGFTFIEEEQRRWFRGRFRTLILSLVTPLLGVAAAFSINNPAPLALVLVAAVLLQYVISLLLQKEVFEATSPLLEDLEKAREAQLQAEKKNEELHLQMNRRIFEQGLILDFGRKTGSNLTLKNIFTVLQETFHNFFMFQSCILFLAESVAGETFLVPKRWESPYAKFCENLRVRIGENIVGAAAKFEQGFLEDPRKKRQFSLLIEGEQAEMSAPLIVEGKPAGVLYVGQSVGEGFTEDNLRIFTTIAYQVAIVLRAAQVYEKKEEEAATDGLTGLRTHRSFQERLKEEFNRSKREAKQPLSLIMLDLDHFKEYNDTFGHPQGDSLLKKVSEILKECTRAYDVVCRYGGDEFTILLPNTAKETAVSIAMRIREAIELRVNSEQISRVKITTSIGVASFPEDASDHAALLKEADTALYASKHGGRNQVVAARRV